MKNDPTVIMIGTACMDEYYRLDHWISEGDKTAVHYLSGEMGGMMPNASCVLAGLGVHTRFIDQMNTGILSRSLLAQLKAHYVDTSLVRFNDTLPDNRCFIFLSGKERTVFAVHSPKPPLTPDKQLMENFYKADYIYTTLDHFQELSDPCRILEQLKKHGVRIAFDIENHSYSQTELFLIHHGDVLFFNEYGFKHYCECAAGYCEDVCSSEPLLNGSTSEKNCIEHLFKSGVRHIAVTLGASGCRCHTPQQTISIPGHKVLAVDTTGAGDTFNAAFLYGLIKKYSLSKNAVFANGAAALAVIAVGPKAGVHTEAEIWRFIRDAANKNAKS